MRLWPPPEYIIHVHLYGDPSREERGQANFKAKEKQTDCMVSLICCSGCAEVAPYSTGAVLVMDTNHRKEGQTTSLPC